MRRVRTCICGANPSTWFRQAFRTASVWACRRRGVRGCRGSRTSPVTEEGRGPELSESKGPMFAGGPEKGGDRRDRCMSAFFNVGPNTARGPPPAPEEKVGGVDAESQESEGAGTSKGMPGGWGRCNGAQRGSGGGDVKQGLSGTTVAAEDTEPFGKEGGATTPVCDSAVLCCVDAEGAAVEVARSQGGDLRYTEEENGAEEDGAVVTQRAGG